MCSLCAILGAEAHWSEAEAPSRRKGRRPAPPARRARIDLVNRVVRPFGLKLRDFAGAGYVLSGPTGKSEIVATLGQLWPAAGRLAGRRFDPLDRALLAKLDRP